MNISSVIVHPRNGEVDLIKSQLSALHGVEMHAVSDEGKMIVTIEADSDEGTAELFERIRQIDGVMSVALVYHQFESEPEEELLNEIQHHIDKA